MKISVVLMISVVLLLGCVSITPFTPTIDPVAARFTETAIEIAFQTALTATAITWTKTPSPTTTQIPTATHTVIPTQVTIQRPTPISLRFDTEVFSEVPVEPFEGGYIIGNPDAIVTIVQFTDYLCPACQNYKPEVDRFMAEYVFTGKARWEVRILPTAGGEVTANAGNLAYCAAANGAHWGHVTEVMYALGARGYLNRDPERAVADQLSLGVGALLGCMRDATFVRDDVRLANSLGVTSIPSLFYRLNEGTPIPVTDRSFEGLSSLVDSLSD